MSTPDGSTPRGVECNNPYRLRHLPAGNRNAVRRVQHPPTAASFTSAGASHAHVAGYRAYVTRARLRYPRGGGHPPAPLPSTIAAWGRRSDETTLQARRRAQSGRTLHQPIPCWQYTLGEYVDGLGYTAAPTTPLDSGTHYKRTGSKHLPSYAAVSIPQEPSSGYSRTHLLP